MPNGWKGLAQVQSYSAVEIEQICLSDKSCDYYDSLNINVFLVWSKKSWLKENEKCFMVHLSGT